MHDNDERSRYVGGLVNLRSVLLLTLLLQRAADPLLDALDAPREGVGLRVVPLDLALLLLLLLHGRPPLHGLLVSLLGLVSSAGVHRGGGRPPPISRPPSRPA